MLASKDYLIVTYNDNEVGSCRVYHFRTRSVFGKFPDGSKVISIFEEWGSFLLIMNDFSVKKLTVDR